MYNFLKDKSVLYVEDELDVLKNISTLLGNFFGDFHIASDGARALEIFNKEPIDLLLVDIELPKMNGIELIKRIRKTNKDVPIIVISAYTKTDYLLESVELGLNKYIVKPLTSKKIHELLENTSKYFSQHGIVALCDGVILDKSASTISHGGKDYSLSSKELDFLDILASKRMISYDDIATLWEDTVPSENAIRSYIKHLRKKLPPGILKNRSGVGYFIESSA